MIRHGLILCLIALGLILSIGAHAHEINPGYLDITEQTTAEPNRPASYLYTVKWKAPIRLERPLPVTPIFTSDCSAASQSDVTRSAASLLTRLSLKCTKPLQGSTISFKGLDATLTDVLLRFQPLEGRTQTLRATNNKPDITLDINPSQWDVAVTYFVLGVEHIWFGFDHLLFVLGLVLLIRGKWRIIKTITAFTLAHSLTLIATTLGWISLSIKPVEAVIALSILFLAIEIIHKTETQESFTERKPWIIAAAFGLLHGFGFAGALSNIGMPFEDVPTALLTFNLGVEFGQIVFVLALLALLYAVDKVKLRRPTEVASSYFMGALSVFWLLQRVM